MGNYIDVPVNSIIKESRTTKPGYCDKKYVIYVNPKASGRKIRVNTDYYKNENVLKLCRYYDRGLCNTIEEYENLTLEDIESQAYGSWMDGAR